MVGVFTAEFQSLKCDCRIAVKVVLIELIPAASHESALQRLSSNARHRHEGLFHGG